MRIILRTFYGDAGNSSSNVFADISSDSNANIYLTGYTSVANNSFATSGAHQTTIGNPSWVTSDGIIVKFSSNGNRLWGTYYGGNDLDKIFGAKVDNNNNLIIVGTSYSSSNISTLNTLNGFEDAFIAKFNSSGVRTWGRYFGGDADEIGYDVDVDTNGQIYIVGTTRSYSGIAFGNANQSLLNNLGVISNASFDAFIAKFDSNGTPLFGTYVGGESSDDLRCIKVTANYLVTGGQTFSFDSISTPGSFQQNHTPSSFSFDGMILKFSLTGTKIWGSYYGGEGFIDKIKDINTDSNDNVYIVGQTNSSTGIATPGSFDSTNLNSETGFLAKFDSNAQRLWGTYMGRSQFLSSVKLKDNFIYLGGTAGPDSNIVTPCAYKASGFAEGYLAKFTVNGNILWGTYVGGFDQYSENKICFENNNIVIGGTSTSENEGIADANSYQPTYLGNKNFYLIDFSEATNCNINVNPTSNSPICPGSTLSFNVDSGYTYQWSGPNGFTSTIKNPQITNSSSLNNGTYTLIISDNCSCQKTYNLTISVIDNVKPIPNTITLPTLSANCTVTVSSIPTATDNCSGIINATTNDPLSYSVPGTYTIDWQYNDNNGNIENQNQTIILTATSLPIVNSIYYLCQNDIKSINDIIVTGTNIKWYDASTGGNLLAGSTILQNGLIYYASQTVNGCESLRVPVTIQVQNTIIPTGTNQSFCATQNPTLNDVIVNGTAIKWYASSSSSVGIPSSTLLANNVTYYASQTANGCESVGRVPITISLIYSLNATNYAETICDVGNDGQLVTLSDYNSFLIASASGYTFSYYNSLNNAENPIAINQYLTYSLSLGLNILYARIDSSNGCHQVVQLQLTLEKEPIIAIPDELAICENERIIADAGASFDSYSWSNGAITSSIVITQAGNYSVTVTQNHGAVVCSSTKNFTVVLSNAPTITSIDTVDWTDNQNSITINMSDVGDYEYSINGLNFQNSNVFTGLLNGEYTVTVRDKKGCGIATKEVYLLNYPKFFTPNGDGYNDNWNIQFSQFEPTFEVKIFDRYGKLLKVMNKTEFWDGTFNGKLLPSDDYWFYVTRYNGRIHKGHFAMKR